LLEDIFRDLASDFRYPIILKLGEGDAKPSQLEKSLKISMQELHRQFDRLTEGGLVTKQNDGSYSLTPYGSAIIQQVPFFEFLEKNKKYFKEHTMESLPVKFQRRMGDLNNCKVTKGTFSIAAKLLSLAIKSSKYLKVVTNQIVPESVRPMLSKSSLKLYVIHGENTTIPKGHKKELTSPKIRKWISEGKLERKMIKKVDVMMALNEKRAAIAFSNISNEVNIDSAFFSEDKHFHEWCSDYFEYLWNNADMYEASKIQEV